MGSHAELLTRRRAILTAVDQTLFAVEATTRRLAMKGLPHDVRQMDVEKMSFPEREFDRLWTWGVIQSQPVHRNHRSKYRASPEARWVSALHGVLPPSLVYWLHADLFVEYSWASC